MQQPFDAITDEVHRWEVLDRSLLKEFMDEDGLLNEFALLYKLRTSFPLHYTVFRQTAAHLPHEANTEQLFSAAGNLSDNNGKMNPYNLSVWVSIGCNVTVHKPKLPDILKRYLQKFSRGAEADLDDLQ